MAKHRTYISGEGLRRLGWEKNHLIWRRGVSIIVFDGGIWRFSESGDLKKARQVEFLDEIKSSNG